MDTALRRRHKRIARAIFAAGCILGMAEMALARTEQLAWQHPAPASVASFTIHVGTSPGVYIRHVDVGKPSFQNGAFVYNLGVADSASVYVAISARGTNGLTSPRSNERFRAAPQTPSNPTPPPPSALGAPGKPVIVSP